MPTADIYLQQLDDEAQRQGLPPLDPTTLAVLLQVFEQQPEVGQQLASGQLTPAQIIAEVKQGLSRRTPQPPGQPQGQPLLQQPGGMGGMGMPQGMLG